MCPPHGGPGGPGFGGPGVHPPAPPPHPARHHRSRHSHDYAWLWAPIAAGTLVYGVTQSVRTPTCTVVQPTYALPAAPSVSNSVTTTTTTTTTTKTTSAQKTVYWCEAEQGWWPTVRTCPTGWKAMPAP